MVSSVSIAFPGSPLLVASPLGVLTYLLPQAFAGWASEQARLEGNAHRGFTVPEKVGHMSGYPQGDVLCLQTQVPPWPLGF